MSAVIVVRAAMSALATRTAVSATPLEVDEESVEEF